MLNVTCHFTQNFNLQHLPISDYIDAGLVANQAATFWHQRGVLNLQRDLVTALAPELCAEDVSHTVTGFYSGGNTGSCIDLLVGSLGSYSCPHQDLPGRFATGLVVLEGSKMVYIVNKTIESIHSIPFVDTDALARLQAKHGGSLITLKAGDGVVIDPTFTHAAVNLEACVSVNMTVAPKEKFLEQLLHTATAWPSKRPDLAALGEGTYELFLREIDSLGTITDAKMRSSRAQKCMEVLQAFMSKLPTQCMKKLGRTSGDKLARHLERFLT